MGAVAQARARAERVLEVSLRRAGAVTTLSTPWGRAHARQLVRMLEEADQELRDRLSASPDTDDVTFTAASALSYREQLGQVLLHVRRRLGGQTEDAARRASEAGVRDTADVLEALEETWTGIARPIRIRQATEMMEVARGAHASLLRQRATSVDRYGAAMIGRFERIIATGLVRGATQREVVDELVGHGGPRGRVSLAARELVGGRVRRLHEEDIPEGLFRRYRGWAWRIVRTETARAYNAAKLHSMRVERDEDFPDLQKKILATFDSRTAPDSVAVHGQVRELEGYFRDGAGREYQHPPARPNDRETIVPWRPSWRETGASRRPAAAEVRRAEAAAAPAGGGGSGPSAGSVQTVTPIRAMAGGDSEPPPPGPAPPAAPGPPTPAPAPRPSRPRRPRPPPLPPGVRPSARTSMRRVQRQVAERTLGMTTGELLSDRVTEAHRRFIPSYIARSQLEHTVLGEVLAGRRSIPRRRPTGYLPDREVAVANLPVHFGRHVLRFGREYYAATQRMLRERLGIHGTVTLYRGVGQVQAVRAVYGLDAAETTDLDVWELSSWSTRPELARAFARSGSGALLRVEVPVEHVFATTTADVLGDRALRIVMQHFHPAATPERLGHEVVLWTPEGRLPVRRGTIVGLYVADPPVSLRQALMDELR